MRLAVAVMTLLLTAGTARAQGETAPRIAVVIELAVNVDSARADDLGAALADALNRELEVDAFGGQDVSRTLPEGGLPEECLAKVECVADVATRLDADQLLFLVVIQVGADVQVDSSWVDPKTGIVSARPRVVLASDARAVSVFADAATRFLPDAKVRADTIFVGNAAGSARHMTTPAWITAGVGAAALIAGGILAVSARASYERCDDLAGGCSDGALDSLALRALAADVGFVVGAGCAVATVILYLRSDSSAATPAEHALRLAPIDRGAVVGFAGRF